jgi:hypothetical protein
MMRFAARAARRRVGQVGPLRFYAFRLREAGMIKSTPQRLIAQGTDWRFLNELKRELKAESPPTLIVSARWPDARDRGRVVPRSVHDGLACYRGTTTT